MNGQRFFYVIVDELCLVVVLLLFSFVFLVFDRFSFFWDESPTYRNVIGLDVLLGRVIGQYQVGTQMNSST